jgi:hypothetical protein
MQTYGSGMNAGTQVIMSAAIGGTAEALGGGKFANGAVTGAYVMMFNHLMTEFPPSEWQKHYVDDPIWDNFSQLDYTQLTNDGVAQHIIDALKYAKDNGKDRIIPLDRIFSNLTNKNTLQNSGIRIHYGRIILDNRNLEVSVDIPLRSAFRSKQFPRAQTLIMFGGEHSEILSRPGWHRSHNRNLYMIGVNGKSNFDFLTLRLGI